MWAQMRGGGGGLRGLSSKDFKAQVWPFWVLLTVLRDKEDRRVTVSRADPHPHTLPTPLGEGGCQQKGGGGSQVQKIRRIWTINPTHKVITYIEYKALSGVFRTFDPPPPLHPVSVSSPRTKGGAYTLAGRWGGGGSIVRKTPDIGLVSLQYNPSTTLPNHAVYELGFTWILFLNGCDEETVKSISADAVKFIHCNPFRVS